jgi:hypothetical protein
MMIPQPRQGTKASVLREREQEGLRERGAAETEGERGRAGTEGERGSMD